MHPWGEENIQNTGADPGLGPKANFFNICQWVCECLQICEGARPHAKKMAFADLEAFSNPKLYKEANSHVMSRNALFGTVFLKNENKSLPSSHASASSLSLSTTAPGVDLDVWID